MTFTALKTQVKEYCGLTSTEADTRVGVALNRVYRRVTSTLGLNASRFVTRSVSMTLGVQSVTFTEIEKIDRILDTTDSTNVRLLEEVSLHTQRTTQPHESEPTTWALRNTDADSVVALFDTIPQTAYSLQADGWTTLADLSGSDEPVFPESFHDILAWLVIAEELAKKTQLQPAAYFEKKAAELLAELRFHLADSPTYSTRQGGTDSTTLTGAGGGGSGTIGGTAYTQTALLTFDLGAGAAPFAVAQATAAVVTNLDADKLDGQHGTYYLARANHTGTQAPASILFAASDRLLGRDTASGGTGEELTVSGGLEFTGTGIQRSALTGDVTASAGSNATTIANDAVTYAKLQNVSAASRLIGRGSSAGAGDAEELTLSTGLSLSGTALSTVPAGSDTQVMFNDGGALAGDAGLVFDKTTDTLTAGVLTSTGAINANGGQIAFPATQNPSANANTNDDYEEGNWTPIDSSGAGLTFTSAGGTYVKNGQSVDVWGTWAYPNTADGSNAIIGGLPFAAQANSHMSCPLPHSGAGVFTGRVVSGGTTFSIVSTANLNQRTNADVSGGSTPTLLITLTYRAGA